jgi:RNA-directed DNA polymerase
MEQDNVLQASLKLLLEPIFDPGFSESSYGFRPGKNQRQAIEAAQRYARSGKEYVVDIDLSKFFDRINHDRLLWRVKEKVDDKRIIRLGVMSNGVTSRTTEGTPQCSPLSPLLSNIVLDELDKELERRGLEFCRFADDANIFVGSKKAAERVMASVTKMLERKMKLVVNREKSKVANTSAVKFLGMTIVLGAVAISAQAMDRAMERINELTPRRSSHPVERTIKKRRRYLARALEKAGVRRHTTQKTAYSNNGWWALSNTFAINRMYPNRWFEQLGMYTKSGETHDHWYSVKKRICFP